MRRSLIPILVIALAVGGDVPLAARARSQTPTTPVRVIDVDTMVRYARSLPLGSTVRVRTTDGARVVAVLMAVEDDAVVVQRRSRRPEPPVRLSLTSVQSLEIQGPASNVGVAVAAGALAGIGSFLTMLLVFLGIGD